MLLLRAITTPTEHSLPGLLRFDVGPVVVWASPSEIGPFTQGDALAHHSLVSEIFAHVSACLPARFPTLIEDARTINGEDMAARLERVRDACELAVSVVWQTAEPASGTEYLRRRAAMERLADHIEQLAGADLVESRRRLGSIALLVKRQAAEAVIQRTPRSAEDVRILVNGPWPPYTFVDRPGTGNAPA